MATDKNTGEVITLEEAIDFTHSFQTRNPDELKSFFVGINKLNLILEQKDCVGLRIYNGYKYPRIKCLIRLGLVELRIYNGYKYPPHQPHIDSLQASS